MITGTITGNIGQDAELKHTPTGSIVMSFPVAIRTWKKDEKTTWVRVSMWGKRAEALAMQVTKGRACVVTGNLEMQTYTAKDGTEKVTLACTAQEIELAYEERSAPREQPTEQRAPEQRAPAQSQPAYGGASTRRAPF